MDILKRISHNTNNLHGTSTKLFKPNLYIVLYICVFVCGCVFNILKKNQGV